VGIYVEPHESLGESNPNVRIERNVSMKRYISLAVTIVCAVLLSTVWIVSRAVDANEGTKRPASQSSFEVLSMSRANGSLVISVRPLVAGLELMTDPVLVSGGEKTTGTAVAGDANTIKMTFDGIGDQAQPTVLVLPSVSEPVIADASMALHGGSSDFAGPDDSRFRVVEERIDSEAGVVEILYERISPNAPAISMAAIRADAREIYASGIGATFDLQNEPVRGILQFPLEAESLLESDDAVLEVSEFRRTIEVQIPLNVSDA
jgi:hypothetical protein